MTDDEFDLYSDSDLRRILPELIEENKRLRGLLRIVTTADRHAEGGAYWVRMYYGEFEAIDAALTPSGEIRPDRGAAEAETSGAAICCVNWPRCECDVNERFNHSITDQPTATVTEGLK